MERELSIYVSAAPEMDAECERLGQLLAETTRSVRWTIKRTPGPHDYANPDLEALADSQFYLILLGRDIKAPMGVEWRAAQEQGLTSFAYRNTDRTATPAAAAFAHQTGIDWREYERLEEFTRDFKRRLIEELIQGTPGYGLALSDIEELATQLRDDQETEQEEEKRRGAGRGGVILPSGGR